MSLRNWSKLCTLCARVPYTLTTLFSHSWGLIDNMPYPHCPVGPSYEDCPVGQPPPSSSPSQLEAHGGKWARVKSDLWQRFSLQHANDAGVCVCVCVCVTCSVVSNSATPWTVAHQAPLSMEFTRQEYWSGLPFLSPEDLPNPGIKPGSSTLQADSLPSEPPRKSHG